MDRYTVEIRKDFNLDHIFDCGQCFRWERQEDGSYTGIAFNKVVNMQYKDHLLTITNSNEEEFESIWRQYLDLDTDYGQIKDCLNEWDHVISDATLYGHGIRILKQEPWEALISFIISQNNNIPRIKGCIEGLCRSFGKPLGSFFGKERYAFPTLEALDKATEADLGPIKLGYRAKYITETSRALVAGTGTEGLNRLTQKNVTSQQAYDAITQFKGVGPKVANCILLFGLGKVDSFPIDVWVARIMNHLYHFDERDKKAMSQYALDHFREYGGYAQQYLFYYARGLEELQKK